MNSNKPKAGTSNTTSSKDYAYTEQAPELPKPAQQQNEDQNKQYGFWQIEYYSKYFDVDTVDVFNRMRLATLPIGSFKDAINGNPDLYGPFWITTTVIFFIFVSSCMAASIDAYLNNKKYEYNFNILTYAVAIFYCYVGLIPLGLFLVGKYFKAPISFLDLINVYGYGCSIWLIVAAACIPTSELVRWISVGIGGLISITSISLCFIIMYLAAYIYMCIGGFLTS